MWKMSCYFEIIIMHACYLFAVIYFLFNGKTCPTGLWETNEYIKDLVQGYFVCMKCEKDVWNEGTILKLL